MQAYSEDLRSRVLNAVADGVPARQAAIRFGVGATTATTWVRRFRASGEAVARRQGKKRGSKLDAHADFILALVDAGDKDIALGAIVERLADERGVRVGTTCVWTYPRPAWPDIQKRMARPVGKRFVRGDPIGLRQRIRSRGHTPAKMEFRALWSS